MPKPLPIPPNSPIGLIAPASAPLDPSTLEIGILRLQEMGYEVVRYRESLKPRGYLAGSDAVRAEELNYFLRREDTTLLVCARGGYGTLRILDQIDYVAAAAHPTLVVGYSDITALQLALLARSGVPSVSGPMASVELAQTSSRSVDLLGRLLNVRAPTELLGACEEDLIPVRSGTAQGLLVGGNLAILTKLIGTPYLPDMRGAILFLEDVGEQPYRIDGYLAHLRLAGILDQLGGIVLGAFTDSSPAEGRPSLTMEQVIADYVGTLTIPVAAGLPYGHFSQTIPVPIGVRAYLDADTQTGSATLHILEGLVEAE